MKPRKPTYSLMAMMMCSATEPMPEFMRKHQLARIHSGLESILTGPDPTADDWRDVADAINMVETLVHTGIAEDISGLLPVANHAMAHAAMRKQKGAALRFDAAGVHAVRAVVQDYTELLGLLTHRQVIGCHRETERRVFEHQRNNGRKSTQVVSL